MIKVRCIKSGDSYKSICVTGHAGYDDYGKDIVCAAVSVLYITTVNSIKSFAGDKIKVSSVKNKKGTQEFSFKDIPSEKAKLLCDSFMLGVGGIKKEYKDFISVEIIND